MLLKKKKKVCNTDSKGKVSDSDYLTLFYPKPFGQVKMDLFILTSQLAYFILDNVNQ